MKRDDFEARIVQKAWTDPAYRRRLLANPKQVLSEELGKIKEGVSIPANVKVTVLEEKPDQIYLVIPLNAREVTGALTEEQLKKVAGGTGAPPVQVVVPSVLDVVQVVQVVIDTNVAVQVQAVILEGGAAPRP
jgi:hypothetical protein